MGLSGDHGGKGRNHKASRRHNRAISRRSPLRPARSPRRATPSLKAFPGNGHLLQLGEFRQPPVLAAGWHGPSFVAARAAGEGLPSVRDWFFLPYPGFCLN